MSDLATLQFEVVRGIAGALISVAVVLCLLVVSAGQQ